MNSAPDRPPSAIALEKVYGEPSEAAIGSAVFWQRVGRNDGLESVARATYRHFVGPLWDRYGEDAWMGPWREVQARSPDGARDVLTELQGILDAEARRSLPLLFEAREDADAARAALAAAFDDPGVTRVLVFNIGDGEAMSGLLVAGLHQARAHALVLLVLMD